MNTRSIARPLHLLSAVAAVGVVAWSHAGLPEQVAIHFNASGVADSFASRSTSQLLLAGTVVVMTVIFWGIAALIRVVPVSMVNIPHREYWLAPERKERTVASIGAWGHWFGAGVNLFLGWVAYLAAQANLASPPRLDPTPMISGLVVFGAVATAGVIGLVVRFARRPPA